MFRQSKSRSNFLKNTILSISASGSLWLGGLGIGYWLIQGAIAPPPVQAATERLTISITRQFNETYQSMLRRAEAAVRAAAQRSFDQDVLITDVTVNAIGQNAGAITPMFTLEVSRSNWRTSPNPERWANYYSDAQSLLNLSPRTSTTPAATTPATTTPTVVPAAPIPQPRPATSTQPVINTTTPTSTPPTGNPTNRPPEEELVIF